MYTVYRLVTTHETIYLRITLLSCLHVLPLVNEQIYNLMSTIVSDTAHPLGNQNGCPLHGLQRRAQTVSAIVCQVLCTTILVW